MAWNHITAGSAINISGACGKLKITVNAALTGTITISDEKGTTGSPVVGIITNPTVGSVFEYWDLKNGVCITPNGTCEITANTWGGFSPK